MFTECSLNGAKCSLNGSKRSLKQAIADFTRVLELEPGHRSALVMRGEAYRTVGNEEAAIADYSRALFIDPADVEAYIVRGRSNLKQVFPFRSLFGQILWRPTGEASGGVPHIIWYLQIKGFGFSLNKRCKCKGFCNILQKNYKTLKKT
jgi:tetratricopeptide (TPR) repeat protein